MGGGLEEEDSRDKGEDNGEDNAEDNAEDNGEVGGARAGRPAGGRAQLKGSELYSLKEVRMRISVPSRCELIEATL